jgi:hypothetical protein
MYVGEIYIHIGFYLDVYMYSCAPHMYTYVCIHVCIYIYIYAPHVYVYRIHICVYVCIYILVWTTGWLERRRCLMS